MAKNTITQLNSNLASSVSLSLDSLAGARYTACGAAQLTINEPRLRYLHLVGDPHLRELDLSSCAAGLHLNLSDCPNLRLVRLPSRIT